MVQKTEQQPQVPQQSQSQGNRNYENRRNFKDGSGNGNGSGRGGQRDNSYRNNRNNSNTYNSSNYDRNDRGGSYNNENRYQNRTQTMKVKVEETIEDISADIARIEKEIQLMISEIKNMKL